MHDTQVRKSPKPDEAEETVGVMVKFKLICPDCDAVIITSSAEALIWEVCPACRRHRWDMGDVMMAELAMEKHVDSKQMSASVRIHSN